MSLIDRKKLSDAIHNKIDTTYYRRTVHMDSMSPEELAECDGYGKALDEIYDILNDYEEVPFVDAVEVVRCKDCNSFDNERCYCEYLGRYMHTDDFCSMREESD